MMLVYPAADIPIVQLSLRKDMNPEAHFAIGRALAPLRDQGVLIVGSGMSYHNLRYFRTDDENAVRVSEQFDAWLADSVTEKDRERRESKLTHWEEAPGARACHPSEEHLVPLFVAAGAAGTDCGFRSYNGRIFGKALSGFQFG
jgi:aromatic ring-opening dioxygenase catalytic subunit (LigB family)